MSVRRPLTGWEFFWHFYFEVVHFGAKVTNDVHHQWFSGLQLKD